MKEETIYCKCWINWNYHRIKPILSTSEETLKYYQVNNAVSGLMYILEKLL